jgi:hypothetical protein
MMTEIKLKLIGENMKQEIITGQIVEYNSFRQQVTELKQANSTLVFDYESAKGEKNARSHINTIRLSKGAVERTRKELSVDLLLRKRLINDEAKQITADLDDMIDIHMKPLEEKAEREEKRKEAINEKILELNEFLQIPAHETPDCFRNAIEAFNTYVVDDSFAERLEEATELQARVAKFLVNSLSASIQREKDASELAELRAAKALQAERDRIAAEEKRKADEAERIKAEADERAKKEAQEAAQKMIDKANAAKLTAEKEAERIKKEAVDAEAKRISDEAKRVALEAAEKAAADKIEAARIANVKHRKAINNAAKYTLIANGMDVEVAHNTIRLIAGGLIAHVTINY